MIALYMDENVEGQIDAAGFLVGEAHLPAFTAGQDEAFDGHPLSSRGLHPYAVFEVVFSSLIRQLERMNRVHPYHRPEEYACLKHFIFAFHDSNFECVARRSQIDKYERSIECLIPEMHRRLRW